MLLGGGGLGGLINPSIADELRLMHWHSQRRSVDLLLVGELRNLDPLGAAGAAQQEQAEEKEPHPFKLLGQPSDALHTEPRASSSAAFSLLGRPTSTDGGRMQVSGPGFLLF